MQAKVDMPKTFAGSRLDGVKADSWIFSINLYFTVLDVPEQQQAMHAAFNFSEEAAVWLRLLSFNISAVTWQ